MPRAPRGGSWLDYDLVGEAGPRVLMIMGMGATRVAWHGQVELLAGGHRLLPFDNIGVGGSGPLVGPVSIASMADDAAAVLDHAGWDSAHVVGISMGGMIAQELALRHPDRLASLSLLSTHGGSRGPGPLPTARGLWLFALQRLATIRGDDRRRTELLLRLLYPDDVLNGPAGQATREHMGEIFSGPSDLAVLRAQTRAVGRFFALPRLDSITTPTLVVRSGADLLVHPRAQDRLIRALPNPEVLHLPEAGHGALAQCGARIAEALAAHIAGAERVASAS